MSAEFSFEYQWAGNIYIYLDPATRLYFLLVCKRFLEIGLLTLPPWSIYVSKKTQKLDCGLWHACRNNHIAYHNKWKKIANERWPSSYYLKSSLLNCVDRSSIGSVILFQILLNETSEDIIVVYPEVFIEACIHGAIAPLNAMFARNKTPRTDLVKTAIHNTLSSKSQNIREVIELLVARKECTYAIFFELLFSIESGIDVNNKPIEAYECIKQFRLLINCNMNKFGNPTAKLRGLLSQFRDSLPEYTQILTEKYTYCKLTSK